MRTRILTGVAALMLALPAYPQVLSFHEDNYIVTGPSLRAGGGCDIKFQVSLRLFPVEIGEHWRGYFAYTQLTTWDAYYRSAPFHDNSYMPGIHFDGDYGSNSVRLSLEHRSNGRPYWGNLVRSEEDDFDDYSRGMNYLKVVYRRKVGNSTFYGSLKAGTGVGIGDYARYSNPFSQDLYLYYLGYLALGYEYDNGTLGVRVEFTPLLSPTVGNATAELWWRFSRKLPALMVQASYGYENQCDCYEGSIPQIHVRAGFKVNL